MITSDEIKAEMAEIKYESTRLQGMLLGMLEENLDGNTLVLDPSMPFPFLMEASVVLASAAIERDEILNYRQYPIMANTEEDLYYHMSDVDFEGMFDTPAGAWFYFYISKEEIISKAAQVGSTGTKKITIPKHTQIVVNNIPFTMQYPINMIVKSHGAVDVVYDGSNPSPLQDLNGNRVVWDTVKVRNVTNGQTPIEFVRIRTYLKQMRLTSYPYSLSGATVLKKTVTLTDNFYYARAFMKNASNQWIEIKTSHSQQVFDVRDPTLLLKVIEGELTIELPYIYFATDLVSRDIRVDVYTTKGPMVMDLSGLEASSFVATFRDLDNDDNGIYTSPLEVMNTITVISDDVITGGTASPTFEQRRGQVISNSAGDPIIPISPAQMSTALTELGFDSMIAVDNVTKRTFLTTKAMPVNENGQASTGIDSAVLTLKKTMAEMVAYDSVVDNGNRITIMPKMLYKAVDGTLTIISDTDREALESLAGDAFSNQVNDGYLYTPFHYVLDAENNSFSVRPYYLDAPTIDVTSYSNSNDTLGLVVSSGDIKTIETDGLGYRLVVVSDSNDSWKALADSQVHVQLAFTPEGENQFAYVNGTLLSKTAANERIYEFRLDTNWDIDANHLMTLLNFTMFDETPRTFKTQLSESFTLIWSVSDYSVSGQTTSEVDDILGDYLLPPGSTGVYQESLTLDLGKEMTGLWARSRAMVGERQYLTHASNVQARYATNIYQLDPETNLPVIQDNAGVKSLVVLHAKDELIFDENDDPVWLYRIGDAVMDEFGNPVLASERTIQRWWDVVLFDAAYRYATDESDTNYATQVPKVLVDWINDTLGGIRNKVFELTDLYFHPRNTLKRVEVMVDDGEIRTINTAQQLIVEYYVNKEVYQDDELRTSLESSAIKQIVAGLDRTVVSKNVLEAAIYQSAGTDVINVTVLGLGGLDKNYNVITLLDESSRLCVAKNLTMESNGRYAVIDSIQVVFKRHAS